jgi:hypothetical protein
MFPFAVLAYSCRAMLPLSSPSDECSYVCPPSHPNVPLMSSNEHDVPGSCPGCDHRAPSCHLCAAASPFHAMIAEPEPLQSQPQPSLLCSLNTTCDRRVASFHTGSASRSYSLGLQTPLFLGSASSSAVRCRWQQASSRSPSVQLVRAPKHGSIQTRSKRAHCCHLPRVCTQCCTSHSHPCSPSCYG